MADPIRVTKGAHAREIRSSLTPGRTNRIFLALEGLPLRILEKYPLDVLEVGPNLPPEWDGGYFPAERRITIYPTVSRKCFGHPFTPGSIEFVSYAPKGKKYA